jgi:hypothetical protein
LTEVGFVDCVNESGIKYKSGQFENMDLELFIDNTTVTTWTETYNMHVSSPSIPAPYRTLAEYFSSSSVVAIILSRINFAEQFRH